MAIQIPTENIPPKENDSFQLVETLRPRKSANEIMKPSAHDKEIHRSALPDNDFTWSAQGELHKIRRRKILESHPEIKELFKPDPISALFTLLTLSIQFFMMWKVRNWSFSDCELYICIYLISGTCNHSLVLAGHELSHELFFSSMRLNRWFGYLANLPTGVASVVTFKGYHMEHHSGQGIDGYDMDIPTHFEAKLLSSTLGKFAFLVLQPVFYSLRPVIMKPKNIRWYEIENWLVQLAFNYFVLVYLGRVSFFYLFMGSMCGLSLHPLSGHFIAEHFEFVTGQETYSYYGWLNFLTYNVGYHNEHHDFPRVPGRLLPKVKEIAPEWYDMPSYDSWPRVMWDFVFSDKINLYCRVKRKGDEEDRNLK